MSAPVYQFDPDALSDAAFVPADLALLAVGNRGRLLDARRTPLSITAVDVDRCEFEVRIEAFEDRGARWRLPAWEISRLQLAKDSAPASPGLSAELRHAIECFNRPLVLDANLSAAPRTQRRLAEHRAGLRAVLASIDNLAPLETRVQRREGEPRLYAEVDRYLHAHDLLDMDRAFTRSVVSNPGSGEIVKGHAVVLAELGLCPYQGTVVRDPRLFEGPWSQARRAEHIIIRMAFAQELWASRIKRPLRLYRAAAFDGTITSPRTASFVSCTFAEQVADEHFAGGATTALAVKWRQHADPARLIMTFLETAAFNGMFKEAEALLIGDPANAAF
jgi:hypothetical protein